MPDAEAGALESASGESALSGLEQEELARLLGELEAHLKPEQRAILNDFFLHGLSYEQIAARRGVAVGSVGVFLKRGLEAVAKVGARHPGLLKELEAFLR